MTEAEKINHWSTEKPQQLYNRPLWHTTVRPQLKLKQTCCGNRAVCKQMKYKLNWIPILVLQLSWRQWKTVGQVSPLCQCKSLWFHSAGVNNYLLLSPKRHSDNVILQCAVKYTKHRELLLHQVFKNQP